MGEHEFDDLEVEGAEGEDVKGGIGFDKGQLGLGKFGGTLGGHDGPGKKMPPGSGPDAGTPLKGADPAAVAMRAMEAQKARMEQILGKM